MAARTPSRRRSQRARRRNTASDFGARVWVAIPAAAYAIAIIYLGDAVFAAGVLLLGHGSEGGPALVGGTPQVVAGIVAGFVIGVVAAVLGVAGGELLIPTIILLYGVDIKLAGSLSLAVSLPTMVIAFARYSRDGSFAVLGRSRAFVLVMAVGSVAGAGRPPAGRTGAATQRSASRSGSIGRSAASG